jgi:hypothetical protein
MLLRNQQKMSDICEDMVGYRPRRYPCFLLAGVMLGNAPRYFSNGLHELLDTLPSKSQHNFGHFLYISLEAARFCLLRLKIEDTTEKYKSHQRFFY